MRIGQMARTQTMMYNFIRNNNSSQYASQMQTQLWGSDKEKVSATEAITDVETMRQQLESIGLKGRTVRDMAKNYMESLKNAQQDSSNQVNANLNQVQSLAQQFIARVQYTPISEEATADMQKLALQDAISSVGNTSASEQLNRMTVIQDHLDNVAPSKRAAALNSMNKVWESELDRIGEYIKEQDPNWKNWGDQFDVKILDGYQPGLNVWV